MISSISSPGLTNPSLFPEDEPLLSSSTVICEMLAKLFAWTMLNSDIYGI